MKLFTRYTRLNVSAMLVVFVVAAGALFFTFRYILIHQVDESLDTERDETLQYVKQYNRLPPPVSVSEQHISYHEVQKQENSVFSTTKEQGEDGMEAFRQFTFTVSFEGRYYQFFVSTPLAQTQYLLRAVALVTLIAIVLMLLIIYLVNRYLVKNLLQPFYHTIESVRKYSLVSRKELQLPATSIEEFTTLNATLNDMASRGQRDYQLMRDFTAQAAHEMQTPLAVMRTKLEALIQSPRIDENLAVGIAGIDDSLERLTRLFNSLLLLTKIENGQFPANGQLALKELLVRKAGELSEVIDERKLTLSLDLESAQVSCNQYLTEVLVTNLLNNAIRYNYPGGSIDVSLRRDGISVSNTSMLPELNHASLFRPFYRHPDSQQEGNGLGLSIVKQICEALGFTVEYSFVIGVHRFQVYF
jgi:signal transduction histidine kinase